MLLRMLQYVKWLTDADISKKCSALLCNFCEPRWLLRRQKFFLYLSI